MRWLYQLALGVLLLAAAPWFVLRRGPRYLVTGVSVILLFTAPLLTILSSLARSFSFQREVRATSNLLFILI